MRLAADYAEDASVDCMRIKYQNQKKIMKKQWWNMMIVVVLIIIVLFSIGLLPQGKRSTT